MCLPYGNLLVAILALQMLQKSQGCLWRLRLELAKQFEINRADFEKKSPNGCKQTARPPSVTCKGCPANCLRALCDINERADLVFEKLRLAAENKP